MEPIISILNTIPEPGKLALVGVGLIAVAVLLRKILSPTHHSLSASKADAAAK